MEETLKKENLFKLKNISKPKKIKTKNHFFHI